MPGGLSLQQDEGVEEPLAGVLREAGSGPYLEIEEVLKIRTDEEFEDRWGPLSRAPPAGPVAQLLRGRGNLKLEKAVPNLAGLA